MNEYIHVREMSRCVSLMHWLYDILLEGTLSDSESGFGSKAGYESSSESGSESLSNSGCDMFGSKFNCCAK